MFTSTGIKRRIASVLSVILGVLQLVPGVSGVAQITAVVQSIASFFGVTGLVHASFAGTINKEQIGSIVALLHTLILVAQFVPAFAPIVPALQKLSILLGAINLGKAIALSAPE